MRERKGPTVGQIDEAFVFDKFHYRPSDLFTSDTQWGVDREDKIYVSVQVLLFHECLV